MYRSISGYLIKRLIVFIIISVSILQYAHAELIFTAPPRENTERGNQIYGPIADKLSTILGEKVTYEHPNGWFEYARNMRDGKYDIVFDGPHFTAWRVKHLKHIPIVTLPGTLNFVLVTKKSNQDIKRVRNLAGKKICGLPSPNLGTNLIYQAFENPVVQPVIFEVRGGMKHVYQAFKQGKCDAAILRHSNYSKLPDAEKKLLNVMVKTRPLPNQTFTVSQRLKANAQKLANFMASKDGAMAADNLLKRYSNKQKYFEKTTEGKFAGIEELLEGVVFGW